MSQLEFEFGEAVLTKTFNQTITGDLGGKASTKEYTQAIIDRL